LGGGPFDGIDGEDDAFDPSEDAKDEGEDRVIREKFPEGLMKIGIGGRVFKVINKLTFDQICEKHEVDIGDLLWLPNGDRAVSGEKLSHLFPPGLEEIRYVDEVIPGDPHRLKSA
jgi:hypothetical protein